MAISSSTSVAGIIAPTVQDAAQEALSSSSGPLHRWRRHRLRSVALARSSILGYNALMRVAQTLAVLLVAAVLGSSVQSFLPGPGGFACLLLCILVVGFWAIICMGKLVIAMFRARWRTAAVRVLIVVAALPLVAAGFLAGDYIHLAINYPHYRAVIDGTETRPVRFPWGDYAVTVMDGIKLTTLLYDESGLPVPSTRDVEGLHVRVEPFVGDFYVETSSSN